MSLGRLGLPVDTEDKGQTLVLPLILSVLGMIALGLILIWLNLERAKLAYRMTGLQQKVRTLTEYHTKVVIERDHLLSPVELGKKAAALGLHVARPGQLRRLEVPRDAAVHQ